MKETLVKTYFSNYKKLLFIPLLILIVAFVLIFIKYEETGDFINKDITLKGGVTLSVLETSPIDIPLLESQVSPVLAPYDVSIRQMSSTGDQIGILIESDKEDITEQEISQILAKVTEQTGKELEREDYSIETTGASIGNSFFSQTMRAMVIAFIFMGIVVFLYFRTFVPSIGVIMAALSDIVVTIAVVNLLGIKLGTAGIAALLMLVGYSIDTDIMLTTRVLKQKEYTLQEAIISAFKTGITMTLTTIAAVTVAIIFTESEIIKQIMTILLIGLMADIIYTWAQNSGLLIWYVQHKNKVKNETKA